MRRRRRWVEEWRREEGRRGGMTNAIRSPILIAIESSKTVIIL